MTNNRVFGAVLLIAGTAIGAGMLALPVITAAFGFLPSLLLFLICWLSLGYTAFLIAEINGWCAHDSNLISMAKQTLGKTGKAIAWITYLLLLYSLMTAYLSGMNALIDHAVIRFFNLHLYLWSGAVLLIGIFGVVIYLGASAIDYLNRYLVGGLLLCYILLIALVFPHINISRISASNLHGAWVALPIIITAFGYHIIIPSLRAYLGDDAKRLRKAIFIGSCIPLIIYLVWELLILGVLPTRGANGLLAILNAGQPAIGLTSALSTTLNNNVISTASRFFAFFAIATSFVGVSFSLFDFLADGLRIKKTKLGRITTVSLTFVPPLLFALTYERAFIVALGFAGIFVAILLIILPILMAWNGRYRRQIATGWQTPGGKVTMVLGLLFAIAIIIIELSSKLL